MLQDNPYLLVDEELGVRLFHSGSAGPDLGTAGETSRVEARLLFELPQT